MSELPDGAKPVAAPVAAPAVAGPAPAPAPKLNAIQVIEVEIGNFERQRQQAVANVHACEGVIQAAQHLLGRLKAEAAKAEAVATEVVGNTVIDTLKVAEKVVEFVKKEV